MTAFRGGWVCPSCYTPNRPGDSRCYSCKTDPWKKREHERAPGAPGDVPFANNSDTWARPQGWGSQQERVIPTVVKVLTIPIGVVYVVYGFLMIAAAALLLVFGFLSLLSMDVMGSALTYGLAILLGGFGWLNYQLGKKILVGRRWAWLVGFILSAGSVLFQLASESVLPPQYYAALPSWRWWAASPTIYAAVVLGLAILTDILIRAHMRRRERRASAPNAGGVTAGAT